jgi:HPt (histidine-containing phosphotransfer) domain-containing protein
MTHSNPIFAATVISQGFKVQLDSIWQQNLPLIRDRLARLDAFVDSLRKGVSTPQQLNDATDIAHKFAGSLGMFGFPLGGQVARSLEELLESSESPNPRRVREIVDTIRNTLGIARGDS